jgi:hypothetical protein
MLQPLPYRNEIHAYHDDGYAPMARRITSYQTGILIWETFDGGWIPRVVIECKIGSVTTHDALTYSAKAASHIQVHPYLRCGILIGELPYVPARLLKHGTHFDFMAAWPKARASEPEWRAFVAVLTDEVAASRLLGRLSARGRACERRKLIHRPLSVPAT